MNPFEQMERELFALEEFTEQAVIAGVSVNVICSPLTDNPAYTDLGVNEGVTFALHLLISSHCRPAKNDRVIFRRAEYRIDHVEIDSANQSYEIFLKSRSAP